MLAPVAVSQGFAAQVVERWWPALRHDCACRAPQWHAATSQAALCWAIVLCAAELMTLIDATLLAAGAVLVLHAVEAAWRMWR
jgi:hypothetical protein